jgi:hypothetical protein
MYYPVCSEWELDMFLLVKAASIAKAKYRGRGAKSTAGTATATIGRAITSMITLQRGRRMRGME